MKPVYSDIKIITGAHVAGICEVLITPREWLAADPVIDFDTGRILDPVTLIDNKYWMQLNLIDNTYTYEENPKNSKSGTSYDISCIGVLNTYNYAVQQVLQTLRRSEMVVLLTDMNKRRKLVGNTTAGMIFQYSHHIKTAPAGEEDVQISLTMERENPAPFYNVDNTPEVIGNILLISDGNFLFIS